jgi:hypothetical protein
MRRIWITLLALAVILVIAAPAGADKPNCDPDDPNYTPDRPACASDKPGDESPMGGTMCDPAGYPEGINGVQDADFTFTLEGKRPGTCIDVLTDTAGPWEVTVTGEGARYLGLIPRDSFAPGDSCGGWLLRNAASIYGSSPHILGYDGSVPAATINACGTEWAEWVDVNWPGLDPRLDSDGGDCAAFSDDGYQCEVAGLPADVAGFPIAHPLILHVFMQSGGGSTTFYVDLPPLDNNWPVLP